MSSVSSSWALRHWNRGALQKSGASLEMLVLRTQCTSSQNIKAGTIIPLAMLSELWQENAAMQVCCLLLKHCDGSVLTVLWSLVPHSPVCYQISPSPHSWESDLSGLKWVMTNIFSLMEETKFSLLLQYLTNIGERKMGSNARISALHAGAPFWKGVQHFGEQALILPEGSTVLPYVCP